RSSGVDGCEYTCSKGIRKNYRKVLAAELGRFLNTDEAIASGALYQAAHLSKGFKVEPFGVEELVLSPVQ
ncbi:hypothetical protein TELCIR_23628, partial [Teladorsagia circumcincta]